MAASGGHERDAMGRGGATLTRDIVPKSMTMWGGEAADAVGRVKGTIKRGAFQIRQVPAKSVARIRRMWLENEKHEGMDDGYKMKQLQGS